MGASASDNGGNRWIGRSVPRPEARDKVTGELLYIDDKPFEGLYGATVRTTEPRGRVVGVRFLGDGPDWRQFVIVTHKDVPRRGADGVDPNLCDMIFRDQPYLVRDEFRHAQEPVVLLAHPDLETVRQAVRFVQIETEPLPALLDYTAEPAPEHIQHGDDNVYKHIVVTKGAAEESDAAAFESVFAGAAHVIEATYTTTAQEQCYIEPQGITARVEVAQENASGDLWPDRPWKLIIDGSMQCPYYVHKAMRTMFGLPEEGVQIIASPLGGGFGGKEDYPSILAGHAGLLALKSRRPVKMVYDRLEDMVATTKRHPSKTRVRTALDAEGHLLALDMHTRFDGGAYLTLSPVVLSRGAIHAGGPYTVDHVRVEAAAVLSNTPPNGAFRGFGAPQTIFALERHLDRCAAELGLDPVEIRRRNLVQQGESLAVSQVIEQPVDLGGWMDHALEAAEYHRKRADHARFNADNQRTGNPLRRGIGVTTFMHGAGFTGSGEDYLASEVEVEATADGGISVLTANTEMGQGSITIFSQVAADTTGLDLSDIVIADNDTDQVPNSGPTVASRTAMVVGHLVARACDDLVDKLEGAGLLAADGAAEAPEPPVSSMVEGRGRRWPAETLRAALRAAATSDDPAVARGWSKYVRPPGGAWDENTYKGIAYGAFAWATYIADVEVDLTTFEVTLRDFVASQEIGKVLNPVLAAGQIQGGVVQALGWALLEDTILRDGAMANNNMTTYVVPTSADVPEIRVIFLEQPYGYGPFGAKGIGELPMDGPAPAVVNAVVDALGVQVDDLPCSPERLLDLVTAAERGEEAA